jgi:hypothetical protein
MVIAPRGRGPKIDLAQVSDSTSTLPIRLWGQPVELALIYVELAADDSSFTTGNMHGAGGGKGQP